MTVELQIRSRQGRAELIALCFAGLTINLDCPTSLDAQDMYLLGRVSKEYPLINVVVSS